MPTWSKTVINAHDFSQRSIATSQEDCVAALAGVLEQIFNPKRMQQLADLFRKYYEHRRVYLTPMCLIQPLSCLKSANLLKSGSNQDQARHLSEMIVVETAKLVVIDISMDPEWFMSIFTGNVIG